MTTNPNSPNSVDFYFDPICPWAWITSRWIVETQKSFQPQYQLQVNWRFISLKIINEDSYSTNQTLLAHIQVHDLGLRLLRFAAYLLESNGNDTVGDFYTFCGAALHNNSRRDELLIESNLMTFVDEYIKTQSISLDTLSIHDILLSDHFDKSIKISSLEAFAKSGRDVGTPILSFGGDSDSTFFGPVLNKIPRGEEAIRLFKLIRELATFDGFSELKRSLRGERSFD